MPKIDAFKFQQAVVVCAVASALALLAVRDPSELVQPLPAYDYIVVGSGSAGAVVASRLSEHPDISVLLLEAGPPDTFLGSRFLMQIPALTPYFQRSRTDWAFRSQPQQNAARALNNRVSAWPRGRVLGGSSVLNYMQVTSQLTPHNSHLTPHTSQLTPHTSQLTPHSSQLAPYTSQLTTHSSQLTPHTSQLTPHTSQLTPHTSHLTPHTSHLTTHTSHLTPHNS